ncbi:hypothetical protein O6H91_09G093600 [Diphasiastrum complanatum]|uniref:Uncharacterized protein n=1 Tax=Diphasiastrum complanatum TaxID=34168 RepID=A0ACC2CS73_DIPCM|nr:hypothetical protein O6H91_09G093600 [Diphasiastrum complanatum]
MKGGDGKAAGVMPKAKHSTARGLTLQVPMQEEQISEFLCNNETFQDGDLFLSKEGLRQSANLSDGQISLEELETIKVIGKGSSGTVQLVHHKWTGRLFALKNIQINIEELVRRQIVQELKINRSSQCPHVVVCYDAFYKKGVISIVLEYMDGGSLQDVIKHVKVIPEPYLAVICKQHQRHVIHRDIKPSNLLVNRKGEVKIADFGVSAVLSTSIGQRDTFVGTCAYMSPERISGGAYGYDSDIWSLGLTLLECALGRYPYLTPDQEHRFSDFYELLEMIVDQPTPFAPADQFSSEFCSLISACIQKEPKNRMSAAHLLQHPFLQKYEAMDANLVTIIPELIAGVP